MKLKNTNRIALWALAAVATLTTSHAAIISVTTTPYVYPNAGTNADTIQGNAGGALITVNSGSTLTGNAAGSNALVVTVAGYTVNNSGILTGNAAAGAVAGATVNLNNLVGGKINSAATQGVSITVGSGSVIANSGIIEGADDGIRTATNTLTITNAVGAEIKGITGATSDGIQALDSLTLNNSGTVSGAAVGVRAGATASITNSATGLITGTANGVNATTGLIIINNGTISATAAAGNGVAATTGANITNNAGAVIQGLTDAVQVTSTGTINNSGTIRSTAAVGTANCDGVQITDGTITNAGTIIGADRGIRYAGAGIVNNSGAISGVVGIDFAGAATTDVLTMTGGTIGVLGTGTNAVLFGAGDDTLKLNAGVITGIVDGGAGNDTATFDVALNGTTTITGNVIGFETMEKKGQGTATINGASTANTIAVNNGTLVLNGNVTPPSTAPAGSSTQINLNLGELSGTGTWTANVIQAGGNLSAGATASAIGTLTLGADATGTKLTVTGGNLLVHMNPGSSTVTPVADLINVSSNASISGANILVSPTTLDAPLQNGSTTVLHVVGTRSGQYTAATFMIEAGRTDAGPLVSSVGTGAFTSSTVLLGVGNGTTVNDTAVTVLHNYANPALSLTSFGSQFGASLNNRVTESLGNPLLADFLGYLDYSSATAVAGVLNAYEPTALQAAEAFSVMSARELHRIVEQQNAGERMFPGGTHVWGNYNYGDYEGGNSNRFTVGVGGVIDTFRFGALVSYVDANLSDNEDIESLAYGAYFGMGGATGWQFNGYIGGSHNDTTTSRATWVGAGSPVFSIVNFNPSGDGFQALLSGAYMMEQGGFTWGPTFGVEYATADMDGSMYPGANLPGMQYSADKLKSLRSLVGLRAEFAAGEKVRPYASAEWAHDFDGETDGYTATFAGGSAAVSAPLNLAQDSIILRAGFVVGITEGWFGDVGYLGELSTNSDGVDYNGLNVGLHGSF